MKTELKKVGGWTPMIDSLVLDPKYGLKGAAVFGVVWRHCQMRDGVCNASLDRMGELVGIKTRDTIIKYLKRLVKDGYLIDTTPGIKNIPHTYKDAGKLNMAISLEIEPSNQQPHETGVELLDTSQDIQIGVELGVETGVEQLDMNTLNTLREDEGKGQEIGLQKPQSSPSAQAEAKTTSALADNNFPQIVKDIKLITNYFPPKDQWVFLEKKFPEGVTDMTKARNYYNYARAKHINPQNYDVWLIEWYSTDGYYMHPKDKAKFYELYGSEAIQHPDDQKS